jgi:hypothetical protein
MSGRTLLSLEQRARLFAIPTTPAEMARHYVLSPDDLLLVRAKRRSVNRLGFAVQLCLLRHPGQGLGPGQQPSAALLDFVAGQPGIPPAAITVRTRSRIISRSDAGRWSKSSGRCQARRLRSASPNAGNLMPCDGTSRMWQLGFEVAVRKAVAPLYSAEYGHAVGRPWAPVSSDPCEEGFAVDLLLRPNDSAVEMPA